MGQGKFANKAPYEPCLYVNHPGSQLPLPVKNVKNTGDPEFLLCTFYHKQEPLDCGSFN